MPVRGKDLHRRDMDAAYQTTSHSDGKLPFAPPCGEAMGRWQRAALTEGLMA
ncbi:hypothetical protein HDC35_003709 [Sphingopyxis sp. JAI128]|nr:hypothetical protein [Sphingopyxis sp. JAI128]